MATNLRSLQRVQTPKGPAIFLGYFADGQECVVSRRVPASELNQDELLRRKPAMRNGTPDEFAAWRKTATFIMNEIYAVGDVQAEGRATKEQRA